MIRALLAALTLATGGCATCNEHQGACAAAAVMLGVAAGVAASHHSDQKCFQPIIGPRECPQ